MNKSQQVGNLNSMSGHPILYKEQPSGVKAYWDGKQVTCRCPAYEFPHRFTGGSCTGWHMAKNCFDNRISCQNCNCLHSGGCDVVNETESPAECLFVLDFCADYQIKLRR